jgi:hypothetical protein
MESRNYAGRMPVATSNNGGHAVVGAVLLALVAARWGGVIGLLTARWLT